MRLNDPLVTEIEYKGVSYPLYLAFDNILDVFDVLNDRSLMPDERLDLVCDLLVGDNELSAEDKLELYTEVLESHIMITEEQFVELDVLGNPMPSQDEKVMDLELDAKFIYASFFALGINLFEQQGVLSWVEFQSLLEALPDDSIMSKIIQIRRWEPSKGDSQDHIIEMRKLQKKYALPGTKVGDDNV